MKRTPMTLVLALAWSIASTASTLGCNPAPNDLDFGAKVAATTVAKAPTTSAPKTLLPTSVASGIGTNLAELREYGTERPFNDVFKQSRAWISTTGDTWDDKRSIATDARGNVLSLQTNQKARALVFWGDGLVFPSGTYSVTWTGTGELDLWPQGGTVSSTGKGSASVDVDPKKGGLAVTITAILEPSSCTSWWRPPSTRGTWTRHASCWTGVSTS